MDLHALIKQKSLDKLSDEELIALFEDVNEFNQAVYDFAISYESYMKVPKNYGDSDKLSMIEAHIIYNIFKSPGINAIELNEIWNVSKAYISKIINKLESDGYIYREINPENKRKYDLYLTKKGEIFNKKHMIHDIESTIFTTTFLSQDFSLDEIAKSRIFLRKYKDAIEKE